MDGSEIIRSPLVLNTQQVFFLPKKLVKMLACVWQNSFETSPYYFNNIFQFLLRA